MNEMIDSHVHLGYDEKTNFSLGQKELSTRIDKHKLEGAIVFSCPNVPVKNENPFEDTNKLVLEASKADKRLIPFMFVHPFLDNSLYVQRNHSQFNGFKLYPKTFGMEYDYRYLNGEIMAILGETKKPILFHTGYREGQRIRDLIPFLKRVSNPCLLAHCGDLMNYDLRAAKDLPNIIIDTAPMATMIQRGFFVDSMDRDKKLKNLTIDSILDYLFELFGPERIIWGSDAPWCDNLIEDGYRREVEVLRKMEERGLKTALF